MVQSFPLNGPLPKYGTGRHSPDVRMIELLDTAQGSRIALNETSLLVRLCNDASA